MSGSKASEYALSMAHSPYQGQHCHYRRVIPKMAAYMRKGRDPHSSSTNLETNSRTPPTSQAPSLNDSLHTQLSQIAPNAHSDLDLIHPHGALDPSTSFSNRSSQKRRNRTHLVEPDGSTMEQDENVNMPVAEVTEDKDHTSAPKRMGNRELKPSESSSPTSPVQSSRYKHSRNSSRTSRGSQISEVRSLSQHH